MTITLPNPFEFESADRLPTAGQLTAHVDHAAVLSIREAAGKRPDPSVSGNMGRRQQRNTGGVTAGETAFLEMEAPNPRSELALDGNATSKSCVTARRDEQPFFSIDLPEKPETALIPSAEVTAELEAGIAAIVAGVARKRSHIAFRRFASNSTFIPTT